MKKKFQLKASATIEASFLIPLSVAIMVLLINLSAYLYNKEAISKILTICVIHATQMQTEQTKTIKQTVEEELTEQIEGRLLFHPYVERNVQISPISIKISAHVQQPLIGDNILSIFGIKKPFTYDYFVKKERIDVVSLMWEKQRLVKGEK